MQLWIPEVNEVCKGFGSLPWRLTWVIGQSLRTPVQGEQGEDYVFWVESQPLQPDVELSQQLELVYQIKVFIHWCYLFNFLSFSTCSVDFFCRLSFPPLLVFMHRISSTSAYLIRVISVALWWAALMITFCEVSFLHHFECFLRSACFNPEENQNLRVKLKSPIHPLWSIYCAFNFSIIVRIYLNMAGVVF